MKSLNFIVGWTSWKGLVSAGLFIFASMLHADAEQEPDIDPALLEFLGAWQSHDENWRVILDDHLWGDEKIAGGNDEE